MRRWHVSISLSSGFSFQGGNRHKIHLRFSRFQSRYRAASHFRYECERFPTHARNSFNLVIERLLISGVNLTSKTVRVRVSISLSSGFSFQVFTGLSTSAFRLEVSISLSSGFSFQVDLPPARICKSASFNLVIERLLISGYTFSDALAVIDNLFQSRYRAASHFRVPARGAPDTLWLNARTSANVHFQRDDAC